jgi:hypothetical protein
MTLSLEEYVDTPHTEARAVRRQRQRQYQQVEHVCMIYHKMDQSLARAAEYLQAETEQTTKRRAKKQTTRAQRQTRDVHVTEHDTTTTTTKTRTKTVNTAHATPAVDPVSGLTWQEKRVARQQRRQQQQQQLTHAWSEKIDLLMESHVPERLILPLLRKYDGDVDAILAYHVAYHQQRVASKQRAQQQRVKKNYADTTLVRSCAAEERMLLATDPVASGHLRDITLV